MADPKAKVTDEQVSAAIQQLTGISVDGSEVAEPEPVEPPAEESAAEPEAAAAPAEAATTETEVAETDDVQSLRKRLDTLEADRKRESEQHEARWRAIQERNATNQRVLHDRYLRKSSIADKALRTLKAVRTEAGVPEAEVDRVISELQGTMNPESASYAPPPDTYRTAQEDQIVTLNSFLNEKGMTSAEADEFGKWMRGEAVTVLTPQEQAVAEQSLDGFLRLAHTRWQTGLRETQNTQQEQQAKAIAAVKATQRIQRDAARAATVPASAPKKQPTAAKPADIKKLTKNDISELMKRSVEEAVSGSYD